MDTRVLPKGHIPGWTPPGAPAPEKKEPQGKSAKKNEKRREKRKEKHQEPVRENWDSDVDGDEDATAPPADDNGVQPVQAVNGTTSSQGQHAEKEEPSGRNVAAAESGVDAVVDKLDQLSV